MKPYVATGSAIERVDACPTSLALPHASFETDDAERGTAIHAFLEDLSSKDYDAALAALPEEWRDVVAAVDLEGLDELLAVPGSAEVALAYDVATGTARELGRGVGRRYDDVRPTEIPCALDRVFVKPDREGRRRRGVVLDWKTGWATRSRRAGDDWQLRFGALAAARAFDLQEVDVLLVHVGSGRPWIQRATLSPWGINLAAADVADVYRRARAVLADVEAGKIPGEYRMGSWCTYCPAKRFCPAQLSLLRGLVSGDELDDLTRFRPIPIDLAADGWRRLQQAKKLIQLVEGTILGIARDTPLYLGPGPEGTHRWLAPRVVRGNESLDGDVAYDVLVEHFGDEIGEGVAQIATKTVATKKDVEAAIRGVTPRGKGAGAVREVLEKIRARGGAKRGDSRIEVEEIITESESAPPLPELPAGKGP